MGEQEELTLTRETPSERGGDDPGTIGGAVDAIRELALSEADKGGRFETLVRQVPPTLPEYGMRKVWRFADWPDRDRRMGRDRADLGIDLVAELRSGGFVAIQCKFWGEHRRLALGDLATFLADAAPIEERGHRFECLMVVATCPLTGNAVQQLRGRRGRFVSFYHKHRDDPLDYRTIKDPHTPLPRQREAIDRCVQGLANFDRGRLIMACGTGKTYTALRIAEALAAKRVLFVAPSIALVGQARKEWLRQSAAELDSVIVCSDSSAGRSSDDELGLLELDCPVTRNPDVVSRFLGRPGDSMRAVFCTHHSLRRVTEAQTVHGAGPFDLTVVDEAHWTTGVVKDSAARGAYSFQDVHSDELIGTRKRLYMTATPRVYTAQSKRTLETKGYAVHDMDDETVYGPEFYRLSFRAAVESPGVDGRPMLCDYRVVVLAVQAGDVTAAMKDRLRNLPEATAQAVTKTGLERHITRVYGTSLALNGEMEGRATRELPDRLRRVLAFANTRSTSKWYAKALMDSKVRERTTRALKDTPKAGTVNAEHLDATNDAFSRSAALDRLRRVPSDAQGSEVVCNVKLFSEGVDVPSLDAVVFLEPRQSQVDVVQAVGRVMRRRADKDLGYIVVPVVIPEGSTTLEALGQSDDGYKMIGQVLRALQSHDGRLAEEVARLVILARPVPGGGDEDGQDREETAGEEEVLTGDLFEGELAGIREGLFARIVESSGLGSAGFVNAEDIRYAVDRAGSAFHSAGAAEALSAVLGDSFEGDGKSARNTCKIAALLVANACLLHKRLSGIARLGLEGLEGVGADADPAAALRADWGRILESDYRPVFEPALAVLDALPSEAGTDRGLRRLVSCANAVAESLTELGYDHAGPLYHRILDTAASDGAFYTKNTAALLLAELALPPGLLEWSKPEDVSRLRVIDPACGTGTLLMATLKTVKERVLEGRDEAERRRIAGPLHKDLVENVVCGLDINHQAAQLAASNLTLGAPDVDYRRINVHSMAHGVLADGKARAGSLELLAGERLAIESGRTHTVRQAGGSQIDGADLDFDAKGTFDLVVVNPPFTNNEKRGAKYSKDFKDRMREREQAIAREVEERQGRRAADLIDYNSVSTFFTPLATHLLRPDRGTLAKVMPVTACTSASGFQERQYLAREFHVERLVTCHADAGFAFSASTSIHECLMVCRRWGGGRKPPTRIVVLQRNPTDADEVGSLVRAIRGDGDLAAWGSEHEWPADRIARGDWSAVPVVRRRTGRSVLRA